MRVVDSADTTAARVHRILDVNRLRAANTGDATPKAWTDVLVTAGPERFRAIASRLFDEPFPDPRLVEATGQVIRMAAGS